jgi:hypothetical protein
MPNKTVCPNCGLEDALPPPPFDRCPNCGTVASRYGKEEAEVVPLATSRDYPDGMPSLMHRYIGKRVAINLNDPMKMTQALLFRADKDCFAVLDSSGIRHYFPYNQVIKVSEAKDGELVVSGLSGGAPLAIVVFHLIVYKGAIGFGFVLTEL